MISQNMDQGLDLRQASLAQQTDLIERAASQMMINQRNFRSTKMGEDIPDSAFPQASLHMSNKDSKRDS